MAYATATDIEAEFKNITFDTSSAITETEVTEYINQEEAYINAIVSNRYEIPITGNEARKILKNISIACVAYRVAKVLNLKKDVPIPEKFVPQAINEGAAYREAKKKLEMIQKGKVILDDATALSSQQGVKSYNASNNILPIWERDTRQW